MEPKAITKTIVQPEDVINEFADNLGYQTVIPNPNYVPAVGKETIDDTSAPQITDPNGYLVYPQIANPDYRPAIGEPTIPNPDSRLKFVSDKFDVFVSEKFFGQFAKQNAQRQKLEEAEELAQATIHAIQAAITTTFH